MRAVQVHSTPTPQWGARLRTQAVDHPFRSLLALALVVKHVGRGSRSTLRSDGERLEAIQECQHRVPAPPADALGGESIDSNTYARFLSATGWNVDRAVSMLEQDIEWRLRYRPRALRPKDVRRACSLRGFQVLMRGSGDAKKLRPGVLHPPHTLPALQHWRFTRSGMPITCVHAGQWHPETLSREERVKFIAYHMEHYVRRMPKTQRGKQVQRACLIIDLSGFRLSTLPAIKETIAVLRDHYPSRLGVAAIINVPTSMRRVWQVVRVLLDKQILEKFHFLPEEVIDVEGAISWVDHKKGLIEPTWL